MTLKLRLRRLASNTAKSPVTTDWLLINPRASRKCGKLTMVRLIPSGRARPGDALLREAKRARSNAVCRYCGQCGVRMMQGGGKVRGHQSVQNTVTNPAACTASGPGSGPPPPQFGDTGMQAAGTWVGQAGVHCTPIRVGQ